MPTHTFVIEPRNAYFEVASSIIESEGVDTVTANWWSPIGVSFGVVAPRPMVEGDALVIRPAFNLTLNFDVRIMAGAQAAKFFRRLLDILTNAHIELAAWMPANQSISRSA